jgi:hypothetical protein
MHNLLTSVAEVKKFGPRCAGGAKVGSLISDHKMSSAARRTKFAWRSVRKLSSPAAALSRSTANITPQE